MNTRSKLKVPARLVRGRIKAYETFDIDAVTARGTLWTICVNVMSCLTATKQPVQ